MDKQDPAEVEDLGHSAGMTSGNKRHEGIWITSVCDEETLVKASFMYYRDTNSTFTGDLMYDVIYSVTLHQLCIM